MPPEPQTHCKNGHEWTPENTYDYFRGEYQYRQCRQCKRNASARHRKNHREERNESSMRQYCRVKEVRPYRVLAKGIHNRAANGSLLSNNPRDKCYADVLVLDDVGRSVPETEAILSEHFAGQAEALIVVGERPSIDRIDPTGHYTLSNIRLVPHRENSRRANG